MIETRNPHRNFKSENYQDYVQKARQNWTFMNSDSGPNLQKSYSSLVEPVSRSFHTRLMQ